MRLSWVGVLLTEAGEGGGGPFGESLDRDGHCSVCIWVSVAAEAEEAEEAALGSCWEDAGEGGSAGLLVGG